MVNNLEVTFNKDIKENEKGEKFQYINIKYNRINIV